MPRFTLPADWPATPAAAQALQAQLAAQVRTVDDLPPVQAVAGVDVGFVENNQVARAAIAVLSYPDLQLQDQSVAYLPVDFPYIPGLLSFREIPVILAALNQLTQLPDLLLCDGQGIAHPRRCGIACHLGLLTGIPAIGVAKSRLVGHHAPVPDCRGAWQPLTDRGEVIGAALRTRPGTNLLYVSPGHRISLATSITYVLQCTRHYRLPETTRLAHKLASRRPDPYQCELL
ncbi:MAG: deoxyribonuclease V [Gloeomargarita sp. SKYG116]|nr:deoxyribonuclease V [Gloeomargarita sp. SKYG116]MCS7226220.1 deoxyribonuclease V [Gloeomargarita sp. SKYB31]MDW8401836.1 deoxyribonuclease V [Gloeomargarita sp. SKYGB_i_bin116]